MVGAEKRGLSPLPGRFSDRLEATADELRDNLAGDLPMNVGQTEIAAAVAVGQLFVIKAHQVQDGGVQVVNMQRALDGDVGDYLSVFSAGFSFSRSS
jgi:hypothetical protein